MTCVYVVLFIEFSWCRDMERVQLSLISRKLDLKLKLEIKGLHYLLGD